MSSRSAGSKSSRRARKHRPCEPSGLPLWGRIASWDARWKVGYLVGDDGVERSIALECFGPDGLRLARAGARINYSIGADGSVARACLDGETASRCS